MTEDNGKNGQRPFEVVGGNRGDSGLTPDRENTLERMALAQRWPIPDDKRQAIVDRQVEISIDDDSSNRESTAAARALTAMEAQNQADAPATQKHLHGHVHVQAALEELQDDPAYIAAAQARASGQGDEHATP